MLNKVMLIGNAGKDAELKTTAGGMDITKVSLATTKSVKNGDNWDKKTTWHNLVGFNKVADYMNQSIKKGFQIYVEGEISVSDWTTESGEKKYKTEILVSNFKVLIKAENKQQSEEQSQQPKPKKTPPPVNACNGNNDLIDDLPF